LDWHYVPLMSGIPSSLPPARLSVLDGIRRGALTVNALAEMLGVTDNGVRLHLAVLERDGLIQRASVRRSGQVGQPAAEYTLTSAGEVALSSAYAPALQALAEALGARLEARSVRSVFLEAGRRLADRLPSSHQGSLSERAHSCAALLESLGGRVAVSTTRGKATLTGSGCPLAAAVRGEPATCYLIEALLEKHAGVSAVQRCEHGEHPACRFEIREGE
jgi:predicted ArsR family transcriptional regulator